MSWMYNQTVRSTESKLASIWTVVEPSNRCNAKFHKLFKLEPIEPEANRKITYSFQLKLLLSITTKEYSHSVNIDTQDAGT